VSRLLKIIGLFCKEPYKTDYILQKRLIKQNIFCSNMSRHLRVCHFPAWEGGHSRGRDRVCVYGLFSLREAYVRLVCGLT